jgi:hypothetical protein
VSDGEIRTFGADRSMFRHHTATKLDYVHTNQLLTHGD